MIPALAPSVALACAGHGRLDVARVGACSAVVACSARSPLRLLTQRRGTAAWAWSSVFGAGLMPGDDVALEVDVDTSARLWLTTQSSTKVLPSDGRDARVDVRARVGRNALLVAWGDPVACFADARYAGGIDVDLADGGGAVVVDAFTAGRAARGERWAFARLATRATIRRAGRIAARDALALDRADGDVAARLAGCGAYASALIVGAPFAESAHAAIARAHALDPRAPIRAAASRIADGAALRVAAPSAEATMAALRALLADVPAAFGGDPWSHRHDADAQDPPCT